MKFACKSLGVSALKKSLQLSLAFVPLIMLALMPVFAHASETELKAEIEEIRDRLNKVESHAGHTKAEIKPGWADHVTIGGVVEVEAGLVDSDAVTESDIALATLELGIDAEISDNSGAHVLILYEDGEDVLVDEAFIAVGDTERSPLYMNIGRMYVPFGNFETHMVSDPLTLEIAESQEDALLFGAETAGFYGSFFTFNGDSNDGGDEVIEHFGLNLGYGLESDGFSLDVGGGWLNSIADSDGLTDALGGGPVAVSDYVEGYTAHLIANFGNFSLIGEYVGANDDLNGSGSNSQISAYNLEAGVAFPLAGRPASFGIGYQGTDDGLWAGFAEERILATLAVEIMDGTALAFEWLNEEDYSVADGGTGTDWDVYTLQLAAEF